MKFSTALLCALLAVLSLAGSALVGARIPRHLPHVHDEYAYLFAGRTFAQFHLTNPTPPHGVFFESQHLLIEPSLMAKYPAAPGLALAVGYWLGDPIYGVWLAGAAFAAAFAWLLRGFFSPRWVLLGGTLVIAQFGLGYYWNQTFWGVGALAATGGALVFGGAVRVWRRPRTADSLLLGLGVALLLHTRPFEGLLACLVPAALVLTRWLRRDGFADRRALRRLVLPGGAVIAAAFAFLAYSNFRVTGSPLRLPYLEYEHRYLGSPAFVWQTPPATPPVFANAALADFYHDFVRPQVYPRAEIPAQFVARVRVLGQDFLGLALLPFALLAACWRPRGVVRLALASLGVCALPLVFSYYFLPHYQAPAAALLAFLAVAGARRLFLLLPRRARIFPACAALLLAAEALALAGDESSQRALAPRQQVPRRQLIEDTLHAAGGRHLVFVRLVKPYSVHDTWVFNPPPLDANPVLWVWDRGPAENRALLQQFPDRRAVLMTVHDGRITFTTDPLAP